MFVNFISSNTPENQNCDPVTTLRTMENPEEILHSLEEFSKMKPKDIPRELEDYLCFVAKTGDPVYQWGTIKSLFREKLINVITDFYETCPSVEIPPCPNVEVFNYETMKTFILEKLDSFSAAPFTVQRICELLTTPRKEYNRIDKYMRALEKNILVVSTIEPGNRRATENGDGIVNGLESEHLLETNNSNSDINVEEMDDTPVWSRITPEAVVTYPAEPVETPSSEQSQTFSSRTENTNSDDSVITCRSTEEQPYVSIEPVASDSCTREENVPESDVTVTITAIPAAVQKRRDSVEPPTSSTEEESTEKSESTDQDQEAPAPTTTSEIPQESTTELPVDSETAPTEKPAEKDSVTESIENETTEVKTPLPCEATPKEEEAVIEEKKEEGLVVESESESEAQVSEPELKEEEEEDEEEEQTLSKVEINPPTIDSIDDESRSCSDIPQEESSTSGASTLSSDGEEPDKPIHEAMEVDINEESCQGPPSSE